MAGGEMRNSDGQDWGAEDTSAVVDGIIRFLALGGFITTVMVLPGSGPMLEKPVEKLVSKLDKRQQQRELRRITYYMKNRGLISYSTRDYENGIILTEKGKQRLKRMDYAKLHVTKPRHWDKKWRLVFFDIPETMKARRNQLNLKLKKLGFKQLQLSIWIHPFPCRSEIEAVCETIKIREYVTYVETSHIDSSHKLEKRFKSILS